MRSLHASGRHRRWLLSLLAMGVGATAACDARSPSLAGTGVVIRDSAGVRLVTYTDTSVLDARSARVPGAVPRWRVDGVPGRDEPELYRLRSAAVLPDGRVVVAHAHGRELLLLDTTGALVRTLGRAGSGPGEFRAVWGVSSSGDLLVTASRREERADPLRAATVRRFWLGSADRWRVSAPDGVADDSTYVLPSGALTIVPLAEQPLAAVCGEHLVLADSHSLRVQRWSLDGRLLVHTEVPVPRREATDADLRDGLAAGMPPDMPVPDVIVAQTRALRAEIDVPALDGMRCDASGTVWLMRRPQAGASRRSLLPLLPDGTTAAPLSVPVEWRVLAVAGERVLAVIAGADGTEQLLMWDVPRRPGAP